jgi:hypothetical protein
VTAGDKITAALDGRLVADVAWIVDGHKFTGQLRYAGEIRVFDEADEGITWLRGWRMEDEDAVKAFLAAQALTS